MLLENRGSGWEGYQGDESMPKPPGKNNCLFKSTSLWVGKLSFPSREMPINSFFCEDYIFLSVPFPERSLLAGKLSSIGSAYCVSGPLLRSFINGGGCSWVEHHMLSTFMALGHPQHQKQTKTSIFLFTCPAPLLWHKSCQFLFIQEEPRLRGWGWYLVPRAQPWWGLNSDLTLLNQHQSFGMCLPRTGTHSAFAGIPLSTRWS